MGVRRLGAFVALVALTWPGGVADAARAPERTLPPAAAGHLRWRLDHGTVRPERGELERALETLQQARDEDAAREVVRASLRAAGFVGPLDDGPVEYTELVSVGDLDGDGRADTVQAGLVSNDATASTVIKARRGADGKVLWEQKVPGFASVRGARVGSTGAPGVLVMSMVQKWADGKVAFGTTEAWTLGAYGGSGTQLWSRPLGADVVTFVPLGTAWANVPLVYGVGDVLPGKADDVVVASMNVVAGLVGWAESEPMSVVSGADGTPGSLVGPHIYVPQGGSWAWIVPDLSGDGLADLVYEAGVANGVPVVVAQPANGAPVWVKNDLPIRYLTFLDAVGDVTGDKRGDLTAYSDPSNGSDPEEVRVAVISGADGKVAASLPGEYAMGIGDVDHDGKRDLAVLSATVEEPRISMTLTGYGVHGRRLYRHAETLGPIKDSDYGYIDVADFGDVQGDGVADLAVLLGYSRGSSFVKREGLLDGRSGRLLHRTLGIPLHATVYGRGDDLLTISKPNRSTVRVVARDGATGRPLWTTDLKSGSSLFFLENTVTLANVDGDRCTDIVVSFNDNTGTLLAVLRGRDGRAAWGTRVTPSGEKPLSGARGRAVAAGG